MKLTIRQPGRLPDGSIIMREVALEDIRVDGYSILSIDGSTSTSGLAIIREHDGALLYSICATRESKGETPVHYKVRLKRQVADILRRNKYITTILYEEPVLANVTAIPNLFMLRTFIEEMKIENEPEFDYIAHYEIPNMRWKHEFLAPDKVPQGTDKQKKAVRDKIESYLPFLAKVTQDEIDAICMGTVASTFIRQGLDIKALQAKKKAKPFKYNITFIGSDNDDEAFSEVPDIYKGPASILSNGIVFVEVGKREDFDKVVYDTMGVDDDKLLIMKFSTKHHGNIVLQHKVGYLAAQYEYLYALVWRVTRK